MTIAQTVKHKVAKVDTNIVLPHIEVYRPVRMKLTGEGIYEIASGDWFEFEDDSVLMYRHGKFTTL